MNFDPTKENIFEILTDHPWDGGMGKKMLFLKRRYYVFDDEHKLLDGGVVQYNSTIDKIFVRNEDLRGEIFVYLHDNKSIHLKGYINSKLAGKIDIDNILYRYEKELKAPLSRVAKVERYLNIIDIYKKLYAQEKIDEAYIRGFEKNLHYFSPVQARELYIKLSHTYFKNYETRVLESICFFFSSYGVHIKLYEELFMFAMAIQMANENRYITKEDKDFFVLSVKDRLLDAYEWRSAAVSINMINECLLYFGLDSPKLPTPRTCIEKLYHQLPRVQKEYAFYLALMKEKVKELENDIYERLLASCQKPFFEFYQKVGGDINKISSVKESSIEATTLLALIESLGNCKSEKKEVHLLLLFLSLHPEHRVQEFAKKALHNCINTLKSTLEQIVISEASLKMVIKDILNEPLEN